MWRLTMADGCGGIGAMIPTPIPAAPAPNDSGPFRSRWADALAGDRTALPEIARNSWSPVYVWMRASGFESADAAGKTSSFFAWIGAAAPPGPTDGEYVRLSDFLTSRVVAYEAAGFPAVVSSAPLLIDVAAGERRFARLTGRSPSDAFSKRWAVTVLEHTLAALRDEYKADGLIGLFPHLQPFLSFSGGSEERYAEVAPLAGLSVSALHVAVYRFRQRYREMLRHRIADTVSVEEEADSELTRLLVAAS